MSSDASRRGGAPVGYVTELGGIEAASVMYLRMWCDGCRSRRDISEDFAHSLGHEDGKTAAYAFGELCALCTRHGRRPLMRHAVSCRCLGSDEACFANFIAAAASGAREDAMLIATLLVRADMAPLLSALAEEVGHALHRMRLAGPREMTERSGHAEVHAPGSVTPDPLTQDPMAAYGPPLSTRIH